MEMVFAYVLCVTPQQRVLRKDHVLVHFVQREDLGILCHRHTTSKLTKFDDLKELGTLGFRGEALASISYVSHLTVITKRREDAHAWKAAYDNGEMLEGHPVPSAGVNGTMVTIDDLFYNVPMRKKVCS